MNDIKFRATKVISDEKLNAMLAEAKKDENIIKNGTSMTIQLLQELQERRAAEMANNVTIKQMIKALDSISECFLIASVGRNNQITGFYNGDEGQLLSIVDFTFDKVEEESKGEITKHDLIGELVSSEA